MFTRTLPQPETDTTTSVQSIEQSVNERGFYLYEWISEDEFRMTIDRDYLQIVKWASIPLAVITAIGGFIGYSGGVIGSILAVLTILIAFYGILFLILFFRTIFRSYLYVQSADIVITDNHYISGESIIEKQDRIKIDASFGKFETAFDEKFLWASTLAEKKERAKKDLLDTLGDIFSWGGGLIKNMGNSRDSGGIIIILLIVGFFYTAMMGLVYFIGLFFLAIMGRIFAKWAHYYLLARRNIEYKIQDLFTSIDISARQLEQEKMNTISLLSEAEQNAWKDNLSGNINNSLELLGKLTGNSTDESIELKKLLENSRYKDVFNFVKYGNWVKKQILEPIESILLLLQKNHDILIKTRDTLENQISTESDPWLQKPLILQKERIILQIKNFERIMIMLEGYREKLK
jgi:hypothetical protein